MRNKFKLVLGILPVALFMSALSVSAAADGIPLDTELVITPVNPVILSGVAVTVPDVATGPGQLFELPLNILMANAGMTNLGLELSYDETVLTLVGVEENPDVAAIYTGAETLAANPYNMSWDSASDITYTGTLATLIFKVKDDIPSCSTVVTVDYYKGRNGDYKNGVSVNYDENYEAVNMSYVNGMITVSSHIAGDINRDGSVDDRDATYLLRYLAGWNSDIDENAVDVDGDGIIDNRDGTALLRYLAGWNVNIY